MVFRFGEGYADGMVSGPSGGDVDAAGIPMHPMGRSVPLNDTPTTTSPTPATTSSNPTTTLSTRFTSDVISLQPNGGYDGWINVFFVFLINAHSFGFLAAYSLLLNHFSRKGKFGDVTPIGYAEIGSAIFSIALLIAPLGTLVTWRFGTKVTLYAGVLLQMLAFTSLSFAKQGWHLILGQGFCAGSGLGLLFFTAYPIVPQWFTTRRAFATSIAVSGIGFGGMVYTAGAEALILQIGISGTYQVLGIFAFVINAACTYFICDRNIEIDTVLVAVDWRYFKRCEYILLCCWAMLSMIGYLVLIYSVPIFASEFLQLDSTQTCIVFGLLWLGQGVGSLIVGFFADKIGYMNTAFLSTFIAGWSSLLIWQFSRSFGVLAFAAIVMGIFAGNVWTLLAPITVEIVTLKYLPSALSLLWLTLAVPAFLSGLLGFHMSGGAEYPTVLNTTHFVGSVFIFASLFMLLLRAWKIGELERQRNGNEGVDAAGLTERAVVPGRGRYIRLLLAFISRLVKLELI